MKVLTAFGTRPEAIKLAPVVKALITQANRVVSRICVTAQHRGMLDQVLGLFSIHPDHDLNVMVNGQSPMDVVARVMDRFEPVLRAERPDWVLVQGDTTTTMATALAACYWGAKVGHIEAGLRTFDKRRPFPEEINRVVTTSVSDLHFAPTSLARTNLLCESVDESRVLVTGNPGIDALFQILSTLDGPMENDPLNDVPENQRIILATAHRRENFGRPLENICQALLDIADRYLNDVRIIYPVHPNSNVYEVAHRILGSARNVMLLEPLDYRKLIHVMRHSDIVLTDSGGIQEEAPTLGKPVLIMREVTERPEGVDAGAALLVGTNRERIVEETIQLLDDLDAYEEMARPMNLYGDGYASSRIVAALLNETVEEWLPEAQRAN
ncbi:MAG: UDP-N-acetylglucosamine 2-epimerase (non-hydrolyzing) [Candidatus Latescibacteria bacterium]|nr:UDP-N-acetylglucosamine 2-epimerase (non-hydrolyzing) [Candidatus Latescibacterota bacterium]NIO01047.1 UDP-N-acetylglucosamine 2-epimerase (non-hydrolyzing) [Candidatus Latescibacterota bacterium]NIO27446.1 UDP-N-acetylglucosamine 2-epimerase (non-hydrolyzing) [Candidatus Latescibacterota bacterium]NIO54968.1 UDP-N-acetylglucosamine 2-epimerase (non-hydrolyzing) [Candidatus Latescibacterota bacterium]NIT01057.1 UDP-N-acetylglucosamine 2-epimerase (non-hydrolyzing) [Candidatus Latescibactero